MRYSERAAARCGSQVIPARHPAPSRGCGRAVANAAVTVAAVDEGICQLTGFATPDPFGYFTRNRSLGVQTADLYSELMPEVPRPQSASAVGGDTGSDYDPRRQSPVAAKR